MTAAMGGFERAMWGLAIFRMNVEGELYNAWTTGRGFWWRFKRGSFQVTTHLDGDCWEDAAPDMITAFGLEAAVAYSLGFRDADDLGISSLA